MLEVSSNPLIKLIITVFNIGNFKDAKHTLIASSLFPLWKVFSKFLVLFQWKNLSIKLTFLWQQFKFFFLSQGWLCVQK